MVRLLKVSFRLAFLMAVLNSIFVCESLARGKIAGLNSTDDILVYYGRWHEQIVDGNVVKNSNSIYPGYLNDDGDYEYMEFGDDDKFYRVVFDGTTFERTELTDSDLTPPDTWDITRQLYWDVRNRHIILTGNQMYQKLMEFGL